MGSCILDLLTTDADSLLGVVSVGDDEVGVLAVFDGADLAVSTQSIGWVVGRSTDSLLLGDVPGDGVAQAGPHIGSGAGNGFGTYLN